MGFRDENAALRARIQTLESETEALREDKRRLEHALAGGDKNKDAQEEGARHEDARDETSLAQRMKKKRASGDSLAARTAARAAKESSAKQRVAQAATAKRANAIEKLQQRPRRIHANSEHGSQVIDILPSPISDQLRKQLPWGFGFALMNPGVFIVIGLAFFYASQFDLGPMATVVASFSTWIVLLSLINVIYAKWNSPPYRLEFTDGHFALYKRGNKPVLFGKQSNLELDAPNPDPTRLSRVRVSDGHNEEDIESMCAEDIVALQKAVRAAHASKSTT